MNNAQDEVLTAEQEVQSEQAKAAKLQTEIEKVKIENESRHLRLKEEARERDVPQPITNLESDPLLDEDIERLTLKIQRLRNENSGIKSKIDNTNGGISSYISEMSTMLDSEEFMNSIDLEIPSSADLAQPRVVPTNN